MGTIEKRTSKNGSTKFRARIRLRGNPKESATFERIGDAKRWMAQTEAAIHEHRHFKNSGTNRRTFAELVERYQRDILPYKSPNLRFIKNQSKQLDWWKSHLGEFFLADVTASRIVEVRSKVKASSSTINRYMAVLSHAFTIAVREWEWLQLSPTRNIKRLREPRGRVRYLSEAERSTLFSLAEQLGNYVLRLVIIMALSTGARKGELMNLRWRNVDWIRSRLTFEQTKNGERRSVFLGEYAMNALKEHYKGQDNEDWVFRSSRGTPLRIDREFKKLVELAGIENFRFHDLRHSAASYLAMNNATLIDIAEVLGHKTLAMVKRYAHLSDSHTAQVIARMNSTIFPPQAR